VQLERLQVGTVRLRKVDAMVIERGLTTSLLGQSFLNRLDAFQVRGQLLRLQN
jgi:aspartyl protease family protein